MKAAVRQACVRQGSVYDRARLVGGDSRRNQPGINMVKASIIVDGSGVPDTKGEKLFVM